MNAAELEELRELNRLAKCVSDKYLEAITKQHQTINILNGLDYRQINPDAKKRIQHDLSIIPAVVFEDFKILPDEYPTLLDAIFRLDTEGLPGESLLFQKDMFAVEYKYLCYILRDLTRFSKGENSFFPEKKELIKAGTQFGEVITEACNKIESAMRRLNNSTARDHIYDLLSQSFSDAAEKLDGRHVKLVFQILNSVKAFKAAGHDLSDKDGGMYQNYDGRRLRNKLGDAALLTLAKSYVLCLGQVPVSTNNEQNPFASLTINW